MRKIFVTIIFSFSNMQHWGYTKFVANETTLVFEYIRNNDGKVHDSFILYKNWYM